MNILVLNAGSSSLKAHLYELDGDTLPSGACPVRPAARAALELRHGSTGPRLTVERNGSPQSAALPSDTPRTELFRRTVEALLPDETTASARGIQLAGHRIVHGGADLTEPTELDDGTVRKLEELVALAPLHLPPELEALRAARALTGGGCRHIGVFDTAFHRTLPLEAKVYPLPYAWFEQGVQRFGFHGINHRYCMTRAAHHLGREPRALRVITCHLGSGCSIAAIANGISVDTSMGFTPLDGIAMGTRPGAIDPGIVTWMLRRGMSLDTVDEALLKGSGLLGVSGVSGDMRDILQAAEQGNERAALAYEIFVRQLTKTIAGAVTVLGGLDALVFTAGIGEHSPKVRADVAARLAMFGVRIDPSRNALQGTDRIISPERAAPAVLVVEANEEWQIVCECVERKRS